MNPGLRRVLLLPLTLTVMLGASCSDSKPESTADKFSPIAKASKSCVKRGEEVTVTVSRAPDANVAFLIVYSDGRARQETKSPSGDVDENGVFRGSWTVPESVPSGPGKVRIAVASGVKGDQVEAPFNVADETGECASPTVNPATTTPGTDGGSGTTVPGASTTLATGATTTPGSGGGAASTTSTTELPVIEGGEFKTTVTVGKACVKAGDSQTMRVQTAANASFTYTVTYAEGSPAGNSDVGTADEKGRFDDSFLVEPRATDGTATLQVIVQSGRQRSFGGTKFKVGNC